MPAHVYSLPGVADRIIDRVQLRNANTKRAPLGTRRKDGRVLVLAGVHNGDQRSGADKPGVSSGLSSRPRSCLRGVSRPRSCWKDPASHLLYEGVCQPRSPSTRNARRARQDSQSFARLLLPRAPARRTDIEGNAVLSYLQARDRQKVCATNTEIPQGVQAALDAREAGETT